LRRSPAIIVGMPARVMRVIMVVVVGVMMPVLMLMIVIVLMTFDHGLALTAAAYRTHHSTSSSLIRISSPPVTCNW
jgi:hypothetical protein